MKKSLLLLTAALMFNLQLNATVRTVSNHPAGGSQYTSLLDAYNAASNGDTLMLEGTDIDYNHYYVAGHWNKSLIVIGVGYNPDKQNPRLTRIAQFMAWNWGGFYISPSGSGSKFYGIYFVGGDAIHLSGAVNNLVFENCKFAYEFKIDGNTINNLTFTNCVFDQDNATNLSIGGTGNVVSGLLFTSCVFDGRIDGGSNNPYVSMIVNNCLFLSTTTASFYNVRYPTISNSIFMNYFPGGTTDGSWLNNMCAVAGTLPPAGGGGNAGLGNINNTNPNFTTFTLGNMHSNAHNYQLQAGSSAIGAGTGGVDLGVHGSGSLFSNDGEVLHNPIMRQVMIQNPVIQSNGTLNVDVHASKPHED